MRLLTVVGARPQFIKAAVVSRRLRDPRFSDVEELMVHTGQHYDDNMSGVFFRKLGIPSPKWNLGVGSGSQAEQTGGIMLALEPLARELRPDLVLVYGDTNSTLAAALVAAKAGLGLAHVEAGLRSFKRGMPEEVNRVVTDRLADLLFTPTATATRQLLREGRDNGVYQVGDVMYESYRYFQSRMDSASLLTRYGLTAGGYVLATVHRAENTDAVERLHSILAALREVAADVPVVFPLHPRTRGSLAELPDAQAGALGIIDPVPYVDMLGLISNAGVVGTDSGGVQKEAYFASVPCVTFRAETEWSETLVDGWNELVDADAAAIVVAVRRQLESRRRVPPPLVFGDGDTSSRILTILRSS